MFYKVLHTQHTEGVVRFLITTLLQIYEIYEEIFQLKNWKSVKIWQIMAIRLWHHFFGPSSGAELTRLHWLPVTSRIQFEIALLTFKTLITHQPSYIHDLLQPNCSSRQLRSASHNLLEIPRTRTGFTLRSFTYSAPHIWNSLPHVVTGNLDVTADTCR